MAGLYDAGRNFLKSNWQLLSGAWASDQSKGVAAPAQEPAVPEGATVLHLPPIEGIEASGPAFLGLIRSRKSRRKYAAASLSLEALAQLCWAAAGVRDQRRAFSFRTYPSGGARHPLDLYLYAADVDGVETGLWRYQPLSHSICQIRAGDEAKLLDAALMDQFWGAALVLVWVAVPYRTEWRYGPVSHKIVALDAGHACQNHYLCCESLGLGTCAIGAYDQAKLDAFLELDGEERFAIYAAPVGPLEPA